MLNIETDVIVEYSGATFYFKQPNEKQLIQLFELAKPEDSNGSKAHLEEQNKIIYSLCTKIQNAEFKGDDLTVEALQNDPEFPGMLKFQIAAEAMKIIMAAQEKKEGAE